MTTPQPPPPPAISSPVRRTPIAVWIVLGLFAAVALVALGGLGSLAWYGYNLFDEQAKVAIRADQALAEALGEIADISLDFEASGNAPGAEDFVFRVEGSKASGSLVGRFVTVDAEREELHSGILTLDNGRVIRVGSIHAAEVERAQTAPIGTPH